MEIYTYWYFLPLGIVIATLYTSTGISGSNFWIPVYLYFIDLEPRVSFWLALVSMMFGSIGGLLRHSSNKTINVSLIKKYLPITIPMAIFGAMMVQFLDVELLLILFGVFVSSYGVYILFAIVKGISPERSHTSINYFSACIGGFLTGVISVGLGKLILPRLMNHKIVINPSVAAGTTLAVVFATSFAAVIFRLNGELVESLISYSDLIMSIMIYEIPGILIGSQLGPNFVRRLNSTQMKSYVGMLLLVIGLAILVRTLEF